MGKRKRAASVVLVVLAALVVAVSAAIAGVGQFKALSSDLDPGTVSGGGKKGGGAAPALFAATADSAATQVVPAVLTVNWTGTAFHVGDTVTVNINMFGNFACFNNGGNNPNDGNTAKSPSMAINLTSSAVVTTVRNGRTSGEFELVIAPVSDTAVGLDCQGTQVLALFSLVPAAGDPTPIEISTTTADGQAGAPVAVPLPANVPFCRQPGSPDCLT